MPDTYFNTTFSKVRIDLDVATIYPTIKATLASRNFHETEPFSQNKQKFTPHEANPFYVT